MDWALTTPLLLLDLALLGGLPWIHVLALLVADEAMVLTGLFAGLHRHPNGYVLPYVHTSVLNFFIFKAPPNGVGTRSTACSYSTYSIRCSAMAEKVGGTFPRSPWHTLVPTRRVDIVHTQARSTNMPRHAGSTPSFPSTLSSCGSCTPSSSLSARARDASIPMAKPSRTRC